MTFAMGGISHAGSWQNGILLSIENKVNPFAITQKNWENIKLSKPEIERQILHDILVGGILNNSTWEERVEVWWAKADDKTGKNGKMLVKGTDLQL